MDKESTSELKQVIGDTRAAFDISEHDTLVFGAFGLLVAGPNARHHEPCYALHWFPSSICLLSIFQSSFYSIQ